MIMKLKKNQNYINTKQIIWEKEKLKYEIINKMPQGARVE